jgi:hypothetical protein
MLVGPHVEPVSPKFPQHTVQTDRRPLLRGAELREPDEQPLGGLPQLQPILERRPRADMGKSIDRVPRHGRMVSESTGPEKRTTGFEPATLSLGS